MKNQNDYINPLKADKKEMWEETLGAFRKPRRRKEHQKFMKDFDNGYEIFIDKRIEKKLASGVKIHRFLFQAILGREFFFNEETDKFQKVELTTEEGKLIFG